MLSSAEEYGIGWAWTAWGYLELMIGFCLVMLSSCVAYATHAYWSIQAKKVK